MIAVEKRPSGEELISRKTGKPQAFRNLGKIYKWDQVDAKIQQSYSGGGLVAKSRP